VIQGLAGAGIGILIGLLARPFLDAFVAWRTMHESNAHVVEREDHVRLP